jgi:prepilin-type N-terminal cleavage/methylation domain-containing protein
MKTFFSLKRCKSGFTLLELMTVVTIIGLLAAIAMPLITKYLRRSKTSEPLTNLRKIYDGEQAYFYEEKTDAGGIVMTKYFVELPQTPAVPDINKQVGNFEANGFATIRFSADSPVLYCYSVATGGSDLTASFTARAVGDIDGNGITSLFERVGSVTPTGEVEGGAGVYTIDELE